MYSEGSIGLIKAAERFDGTKGARFATFASYYVLDAMQKYAKKRSKVLSLSLDETDLDAEPILDSLSLEEEGRTLNCVLSELVNYADSCENNVLPIKVDFILMWVDAILQLLQRYRP